MFIAKTANDAKQQRSRNVLIFDYNTVQEYENEIKAFTSRILEVYKLMRHVCFLLKTLKTYVILKSAISKKGFVIIIIMSNFYTAIYVFLIVWLTKKCNKLANNSIDIFFIYYGKYFIPI